MILNVHLTFRIVHKLISYSVLSINEMKVKAILSQLKYSSLQIWECLRGKQLWRQAVLLWSKNEMSQELKKQSHKTVGHETWRLGPSFKLSWKCSGSWI